MTPMRPTTRPQAPWRRAVASLPLADLAFYAAVVVVYGLAAAMATRTFHLAPDRMMVLADRMAAGHLDSPTFAGSVDSVTLAGRVYVAVGLLQVLPYLPFVPLPALQGAAPYLASLAFGIPAAWLALPLARRYGATGAAAHWVAVLGAFGTLLLYVSVLGNFYYLAHAEATLFLELALLEWTPRRRPLVIGALLGLAFLARPTTLLAAAPLGLVLLRDRLPAVSRAQVRRRLGGLVRLAVELGAPVAVAGIAYATFNWARFGSPWQNGYGISHLATPDLEARRALGLFALAQVPENIRLALLTPFTVRARAPFLLPDPHGLSMLLVSPGLLLAGWAGWRDATARVLWACAALVAVPVFLYYGGGYVQYGFRYSLDFTPFLVALVAMGSRRWRGLPERLLIAASVLSVGYGVLWRGLPIR